MESLRKGVRALAAFAPRLGVIVLAVAFSRSSVANVLGDQELQLVREIVKEANNIAFNLREATLAEVNKKKSRSNILECLQDMSHELKSIRLHLDHWRDLVAISSSMVESA